MFEQGQLLKFTPFTVFSFPRKTFVYVEQVDEYSCGYLANMHSSIENLGRIYPELFRRIIECLLSSCMLKRKYRNVLSAYH